MEPEHLIMVYIVGSTNTDLVAYLDRLPAAGETVGGAKLMEAGGGKGANQAVAAARAGATTVLVSAVGDDAFGQVRLRELGDAGVDVSQMEVVAGVRSGVALINVDASGENQIAVAPGANGRVRLSAEVGAALSEDAVLIVQNEIPVKHTAAAIEQAKARGATVVWNVAPALDSVGAAERAALGATDYVVVNMGELEALVGTAPGSSEIRSRAELAAQRARSELDITNAVVTLGEQGACLVGDDGAHFVAAPAVTPVDTVGAGDCLTGVFAAGIAAGHPGPQALRRAVVAAALSVTRRGAQQSMPLRIEVDDFAS